MEKKLHPATNKYCVVRGKDCGVHAGVVAMVADTVITITEARRLWYWVAAKGHSLSAVARHGLDRKQSKIAGAVTVHLERRDVCEIIEATEAAAASIAGAPEYDRV